MVKKMPFKEFKAIYSKVPRVCVELIVKTPKGLVLTKRLIEPEKGKWHFPGGTILKGETIAQAIRRVAKEELNAKVKIEKLLGVIQYWNIKNYFGQPIGIAFLVTTTQTTFDVDSQASEVDVFTEIPKMLIKDQKVFLQQHVKEVFE